jgi:carboxymethylenebutenolidase
MNTAGEWFTYPTPNCGDIRAFAVRPTTPAPWPALILIHGINGCGPHTEAKAAEFAAAGYFTVVPDIYTNDAGFRTFAIADIMDAAHMGVDPERQRKFLTEQPEARRAEIVRARDWANNRPASSYIDIVRGCFDHLQSRADVGAIGAIGYCMGGRLVGQLAASGAALAAGVIYYGGPPQLDLVGSIRCPIQGHYASTDHGITDKIPALAAAMKAAGKEFTYYVYEADHGFSLVPGSHGYNAEATRHSLQRIKPFLARTLKRAAEIRAAE